MSTDTHKIILETVRLGRAQLERGEPVSPTVWSVIDNLLGQLIGPPSAWSFRQH